MKKILAYGICICLGFQLKAQNPFAYLGDDFKFRINADGSFAINKADLTPAFANEQNFHFLNQGGLWMYAEDDQDQKYTAVHHFRSKDSADIWPGPIDTLTGQTDAIAKWNKVWEISKSEVYEHRSNYNNAGYVVPTTIANWPSNSENGFANYLAPFVDVNSNQLYDPENGDFPLIKGDKAVYIIANDVASEHTASLGLEIGVEIHSMIYLYSDIPNTYFFDTYLIARKNKQYKNVKVGLFLGGECGNKLDNFGATLVDKNAIVIYNGDQNDENYFESELPYVYGQFLNQTISSTIFFNNQLSQFNGLPLDGDDYSNYINGRWLSGDKITFGLDGNSGNIDYAFMYPRNSDPSVSFWSEEGTNLPGYRNGLVSVTQLNLQKGSYLHLEYCIGAGNGKSESEIFNLIDKETTVNLSRFRATNNTHNNPKTESISVYPNPTNSFFTIESSEHFSLEIFNSQGYTIFTQENIQKNKYTCNVQLASGVYYLKLMINNKQSIHKLIVTH